MENFTFLGESFLFLLCLLCGGSFSDSGFRLGRGSRDFFEDFGSFFGGFLGVETEDFALVLDAGEWLLFLPIVMFCSSGSLISPDTSVLERYHSW